MVRKRMLKIMRSTETSEIAVVTDPNEINEDNLNNMKPTDISGINKGNI
jgi:hypothetical protein